MFVPESAVANEELKSLMSINSCDAIPFSFPTCTVLYIGYLKIFVCPIKNTFLTDFVYVVLDISLKPKQGSQVLIQHGGGTELATLRGRSLITEDGEAIEGEALDDVTVIGVVTFTICDVRQDNAVV